MTLKYQPDARAMQFAEKTLSMKINVQACIDLVDDERDKYRQRLTIMMEANEDKKLRYATDDSVTDEDIERVEEIEGFVGTDVEEQLDRMFDGTKEGLESLREMDGGTLREIDVRSLLDKSEAPDTIKCGFEKIMDIALWQAHALLEFDTYEDAHLVIEAADVIRDRLGIPLD